MGARDYVRMLRNGWVTVVVTAVVLAVAAGAYGVLTPASYASTAQLYVGPAGGDDGSLQARSGFAKDSVSSFAAIIDSATVLDGVAQSSQPPTSVQELSREVSTSVEPDTTLINVTATTSDPQSSAALANAVAGAAASRLASLTSTSTQVGTTTVRQPALSIQVINPGVVPTVSTKASSKRLAVIGLLLGLILGVALTIFRQLVDSRLRLVGDLSEASSVPILAGAPPTTRRGTPTVSDAAKVVAERLLAAGPVGLLAGVGAGRSLSSFGVQLATWCQAQRGVRTLVVAPPTVYGDLAEALGVTPEDGSARGRGAGVAPWTVLTAPSGVLLVSTGDLDGKGPLELTEGIRSVTHDTDLVLVVAEPFSPVWGSVARQLEATVLLGVRMGHTRRPVLAQAVSWAGAAGATPAGLVLLDTTEQVHEALSR